MTDYHWHETREHAITQFAGETPGAELEQFVIDAFLDRPQQVIRAIDHVAQRHAAGKITSSCWGVLRAQLRDQATADVTVSDSSERAKAITRTENWMRTCGIHFDREAELEDELFGERGTLRAWHDDLALRGRMRTLWRQLRPTGEQLERDADERGEQWKQTSGVMWAQRAAAQAQADRTTTIARAMGESFPTPPEPIPDEADDGLGTPIDGDEPELAGVSRSAT